MQMLTFSRVSASTLLALSVLTGCSSTPKAPVTSEASGASGVNITKKSRFLGIFSPYRVDIQQGNFVSKELVAQLKPGMTKDQVIFILGKPLLTDIFHANRWDYDFRLVKGNGEIITSKVIVFFGQDNLLDHYTGGDNLPTESEYLSLISGQPVSTNKKDAPSSSDSTDGNTTAPQTESK